MTVMPDLIRHLMGYKVKLSKMLFLSLLLSLVAGSINAQQREEVFGETYTMFNINNIATYIYNDGRADIRPDTASAGFEFPKYGNKYCFKRSGLFWIGKYGSDEVRMGGTAFTTSLSPGEIFENGSIQTSDDSLKHIFRVRNYESIEELTDEANDLGLSPIELDHLYMRDKQDWPIEKGAPFQDINGDGVYSPEIDIPGMKGSEQSIWFIANDFYDEEVLRFYGSRPTNFEVQVTIWNEKGEGYLDNVVFKRYLLINRHDKNYTDCFIGIFSDPDIGNAADDFVGCDTLLNSEFAYNADEFDTKYESQPPAVGFTFLQGPIKESDPTDVAQFMNREVNGFKNQRMFSFFYFLNEDGGIYGDPDMDNYSTGTLYWYNIARGRINSSGEYHPIPEEFGGGRTRYVLSGDPISGLGFIDGLVKPAKERRMFMSAGPFDIAIGDTQEVIIAQIAAGGREGVGHLDAVAELKETARKVLEDYGSVTSTEKVDELPTEIKLYQNYPNPFNPKSKIKYIIPSGVDVTNVTLKVYDLLGSVISVLVDEHKPAGTYEVDFDGTNLSTGVYFYELKVGDYSQQRKMILLK
ncbi:MAG: T9SS type A sorting domain-containing protein [Bacteroidetes bacterium]|nr:T9SS type A sorting domain-containing protein [Bacteroidota bacterium]